MRTPKWTASADGPSGKHNPPEDSSAADAEDAVEPVGTAVLYEWLAALADAGLPQSDTALIDQIRALEELKSACAAVQARAAAAFDASQRKAQARAGLPAAQLGRGVGAQIALARRDSPHRGGRHLGLGKALVHEMPHTLRALSAGVLSEWRATLLVRETACLEVEDRRRIDALICGNPAALEGVGDRKLIARIRSLTQAIDPASQVRRHAKAVADRYVSCRPAPDTMSYLTGLLPVAQGVAVFTALSRTADSLRSSGDERGRGQIMADTLVERITGQATASQVPVEVQLVMTDRTLFGRVLEPEPPGPGARDGMIPGYQAFRAPIPGQVSAGAPDTAVASAPAPASAPNDAAENVRFQEAAVPRTGHGPSAGRMNGATCTALPKLPWEEPAYFPGYGTVPGQWARDLIAGTLHGQDPELDLEPRQVPPPEHGRGQTRVDADGPDSGGRDAPDHLSVQARVTLRRLYLDPATGELVAMDSKARYFPPGLARMIRTRDQTCRTPWCDAPIRHIDHVQPHTAGGRTSYANGQGLCEACNHAKQAPGWTTDTTCTPGQRHTVRTETPTGHTYLSTSPPLPGAPPTH
ncbi:HNH endonuclease signature motif containing protein [Arthrobacter sp. Helios]|uniref:HNH endonuclease n=1 Tax=Arthrobacter sp. Helios TaxID=2828862 RepID=UPI00206BFA3F|nr:HNH endonuclease signature motif containing protein [Arthrobacter sp. Helios]UPO78058.1 HNH endonuclease [Arthrobacter sp. Helios]